MHHRLRSATIRTLTVLLLGSVGDKTLATMSEWPNLNAVYLNGLSALRIVTFVALYAAYCFWIHCADRREASTFNPTENLKRYRTTQPHPLTYWGHNPPVPVMTLLWVVGLFLLIAAAVLASVMLAKIAPVGVMLGLASSPVLPMSLAAGAGMAVVLAITFTWQGTSATWIEVNASQVRFPVAKVYWFLNPFGLEPITLVNAHVKLVKVDDRFVQLRFRGQGIFIFPRRLTRRHEITVEIGKMIVRRSG